MEPHEHPLLGAVLRNTYRLVKVLDQGGMGTVFVAEHVRLGRKLAVKVLAGHLTNDSQALARFHREAAIVAHLQHPHIVQVLDYDTTEGGQPYIVMELLQGESLSTKIEREGRLDLGVVTHIVHQVALGLAAAHRASVVHRDLKPANVFLADDGEGQVQVKLLDFGISLRSSTDRRLTGEFDVLGTPDYMSPEQAAGRTARVDHRGDQYSLAVITYEALCGATPFPSTELMEVLRQVISEAPVPIQDVAPQIPTAVWEVLQRALAKNPDSRFGSVQEFSQALLLAAGRSLPPSNPPFAAARPVQAITEYPRPPGNSITPPNSLSARPAGRYRGSTPASEDVESEATRPTDPVPSPRATEVASILARAREAFGLGDNQLAASYVERALQMADSGPAASEKLALNAESSLIESVLLSRIGSQRGRLMVRRVSSSPHDAFELRPEQAFLLSRLEGHASVEELLDLSPLPRYETLRHLLAMLKKGVLGIE
ncbi:MAG: protein kinase domain-containing protein [Myxococcota bacterium]